jgi:uncharacterized protein (TIGR02452 family)
MDAGDATKKDEFIKMITKIVDVGAASPGQGYPPRHGHNPREWFALFKKLGAWSKTMKAKPRDLKVLRVYIWYQTEWAIRNAYNERLAVRGMPALFLEHGRRKKVGNGHTRIESAPPRLLRICPAMYDADMLSCAAQYVAFGYTVAVLNMANPNNPWGAVRRGFAAQEENMARRTDYMGLPADKHPEHPLGESCLITENITVFRGQEDEGYGFLKHPFRVTVLSCGAVVKPVLDVDRRYADASQLLSVARRIDNIVKAAVLFGCQIIILGAFGCGTFGNPPEVVAALFGQSMCKHNLAGAIFCVVDDRNCFAEHNPKGNSIPFKDTLTVDHNQSRIARLVVANELWSAENDKTHFNGKPFKEKWRGRAS